MSADTSQRKPALIVGCTGHIVQDGLSSAVYVLLPVLAQVFGLSYAHVGLLKGANNASQAIIEFASGWVCERAGELNVLVTGLVLSALGYVFLSQADDVIMIAACLLLVGAGTALHHAPASALIANNYGQSGRSGALGIYNASGDVGKLAFTGCFSLAAGIGFAWQNISLLFGLCALAAAIVIVFAFRNLLQRDNKAQSGTEEPGGASSSKGWGILHRRSFAALLAMTSIDTVVQTGIFVFMAFLMLAKGFTLPVATGATVVLLTGGVFGKAGCGFLSQRLGARRAFISVQILTALGLAAIIPAPNWLSLCLLFPLGAVAQGSTSISYGLAADMIHPEKMARGYALLYSCGTLAAIAAPFVLGQIADTVGVGNALYLLALFVLLSIPPMLMLDDKAT